MLWIRMAIVLAVVLVMIIALVVIWTPPDNRDEAAGDDSASQLAAGTDSTRGEVSAVSDSTKEDGLPVDSLSASAGE